MDFEDILTLSSTRANIASTLPPGYHAAYQHIQTFQQEHLTDRNSLDQKLEDLGAISPLAENSYFIQTEEVIDLAQKFIRFCSQQPGLFAQIETNLRESYERLEKYRNAFQEASKEQLGDITIHIQPLRLPKAEPKDIVRLVDEEKQIQRALNKQQKAEAKLARMQKSLGKKASQTILPPPVVAAQSAKPYQPNPCMMLTLISYRKEDSTYNPRFEFNLK